MYSRVEPTNWVKPALAFLIFLWICACATGTILAESYWGNPPREQALADRIQIENEALVAQQRAQAEKVRIENEALEARQQIELQALQKKEEDEARARQERARQALLWQSRWNEFGMVLAAVVVAGLLVIGGVWLVIPAVAQIRERLQERAIEFEMKQAERLREERRLEQVRLQRARVALTPEQVGGNGRERKVSSEQPMMSSSGVSTLSAPSSN
jgi:Flp pilus assembly protein TadB